MASFFEDLWSSVFTPGTTPALLLATNGSFALLQCTLIALLFATHSIHFVVLNCLAAGLWAAINWFVKELEEFKRSEEQAKLASASSDEKDLDGEDSLQSPTDGLDQGEVDAGKQGEGKKEI
ncbi:ER protein Pkr1-domain-containing protein [Peziza echinospora]|nr:ER protein Pkr1-domain-containing protein [Peziza echinospora]